MNFNKMKEWIESHQLEIAITLVGVSVAALSTTAARLAKTNHGLTQAYARQIEFYVDDVEIGSHVNAVTKPGDSIFVHPPKGDPYLIATRRS
jgi:hypothetical protein